MCLKTKSVKILLILSKKHWPIVKVPLKIIFEKLDKSKTIIWSGPLGLFEKKPYDKSTNELAKFINSFLSNLNILFLIK